VSISRGKSRSCAIAVSSNAFPRSVRLCSPALPGWVPPPRLAEFEQPTVVVNRASRPNQMNTFHRSGSKKSLVFTVDGNILLCRNFLYRKHGWNKSLGLTNTVGSIVQGLWAALLSVVCHQSTPCEFFACPGSCSTTVRAMSNFVHFARSPWIGRGFSLGLTCNLAESRTESGHGFANLHPTFQCRRQSSQGNHVGTVTRRLGWVGMRFAE